MRRLAWLALGLLACTSCGGKVAGMAGSDAGTAIDQAPPQRGSTDGSVSTQDVSTRPPPPVDAGIDLARTVDAPASVDLPVDRSGPVVDATSDVMVGRACQSAAPNCPAGMYCLAPNCNAAGGNGTCVAAPTSTQQDPVCGCDRITYWNPAIAAANTASVRVAGACPNGVACGGALSVDCPGGALCDFEQDTTATCAGNATGRCWMLPAACPPLPAGTLPNTRRCVGGGNNPACQSACELILAARIFTVDATCP